LHSITFLEECGLVDSSNIGAVGFFEGSGLILRSSLLSPIKAGATFFCGDLLGQSEDMLAYKAGLDTRNYAKFSAPLLINATTNDHHGSLDFLSELSDKAPDSYFCIYPSADIAYADYQRKNLLVWFDFHLRGKGSLPQKATLSVYGSGGGLYAEVCGKADETKLFVAEENPPALRNWREQELQSKSDEKLFAKLNVFDEGRGILVFFLAKSEGFTYCSQVIFKIPSKAGAVGSGERQSRLLYQSGMTQDIFIVENSSFFEDKQSQEREGPFGLRGRSGDCLVTFVAGDAKFRGKKESLLQIMLSVQQSQEIEVSVTTSGSSTEYRCTKKIVSGNWNKLTLSSEDFKSAQGSPSFDKADKIKIKGKGLVVNSLIWV
jgi:hypothetical protein